MDPILKEKVRKEIIGRAKTSALGQIALVLLFFYGFYNLLGGPKELVLGTVSLIIINLLRIHFTNGKATEKIKYNRILVVTIASSLVWCCLTFYTFKQTQHLNPQIAVFTLVVISGLISASIMGLASSRLFFYGFNLPLSITAAIICLEIAIVGPAKNMAFLISLLFAAFLVVMRERWFKDWSETMLSRKQMQDLVDQLPVGVSVIEGGAYRLVNEYVSSAIGIDKSAIVGATIGSHLKKNEFLDNYFQFVEGQQKKHQAEIQINTKKGPRTHLLILSRNPANQSIISVTLDIEDQKNLQLELMKQRATAEASAKMASLGEMSSGLAHEINNPLAVILGRAEIIGKILKQATPDLAKIEQSAELIKKTSLRISAIVKGLKSFAREADHDPFEVVDLKTVFSETLLFCEEKIKNSGAQLTMDFATDAPLLVSGRPSQISQVFLNCLSNALDAIKTNPDGERWIVVSMEVNNGQILVTFKDSGPKVPLAVQLKLGQPFFTTKEVGKGTGLGVSISKGIAETHRGSLQFDFSGPNTQVIFKLPQLSSDEITQKAG